MITDQEIAIEGPLICEDVQPASLRRLASAVVTQALRDLLKGNESQQIDAFMWLTSLEFEGWATWAGREDANPYKLLTNLKQIRQVFRIGRRNAT